MLKKYIAFCLLLVVCNTVFADTIELDNVSLKDALGIIGKKISLNILVSPDVNGKVNLHLVNIDCLSLFNLLLKEHDLVKVRQGNFWYIQTITSFLKQRQISNKLSDTLEKTDPLVTRIWQLRYAKAEEVAHFLKLGNTSFLSKRGKIHFDARTNTLCIEDAETRIPILHRVIERLDLPVDQVQINAKLVSIDRTYERELGFSFSSAENENGYPFAMAKYSNRLIEIKLSALESTGHGEIISSPSLLTSNQQLAYIASGEEIPYQEISRSGATTVAFKKAVLGLKVVPQILPGKKVLLQLQLNQDRPTSKMILGVPAISTREMSTNILVRNGETVVLGGIYEVGNDSSQMQIPFLGKIPIVGGLFREESNVKNKRELLIFVTPIIIPQHLG